MTAKEFLKKVTKGKVDFLQLFLDLLKKDKIPFCIIGGLAVNAYAEPVVSLYLDVIVVSEKLESLISKLKTTCKVEVFPNSVNISCKESDLRIQIQTDPKYQTFIKRSSLKTVLGYKMPVASIEDIFTGKIWAAQDHTRRPSKRQKDMADILRLTETKKALADQLPKELKTQLQP